MQTFLPYPNFYKSASVLDYRRLGKQRVEAWQIYTMLTADWRLPKSRWYNHPAVQMWKGYEEALKLYFTVMVEEWVKRGYKNNMEIPMVHIAHCHYPKWFGTYDFHISHQSNLVRKNPGYYVPIFGNIPEIPYFWPTKEGY